jgi:hypothetical protein
MADFSRGPDDITTRLNDIIERLESDALQEADRLARLLLGELNRLLTFSPIPIRDERGQVIYQAAPAGIDRKKLEGLRTKVRAGRADFLSCSRALAVAWFKQARDYWVTAQRN